MRIIVFDVPAESGGALTILNQYYAAALNNKENEWIFIVSTPQLKESENVRVENFPWIKKSWVHRLYFDEFIAHKLVKKYDVDEVLSLQNIVVSKVKVKQTLYLHQPLPFVEKRYGLFENFKFWVYQNIISKIIFKSIRDADKVIVQTKWIMNAAIDKANVNKEKFVIKRPILNVEVKNHFKLDMSKKLQFFYPASGFHYKNHHVIVKAISILMREQPNLNIEVIFTLNGNENKNIKDLYETCLKKHLPINFIGNISINKVYDYYSKSILLFPSYIETFGLPMLEARMHSSPILASDCSFSHEILDDYSRAEFFDPFEENDLARKIHDFTIKYLS